MGGPCARGRRLVCVAHVSNVLGIVNPVRQMADAAHEAGARILVDAAQSMAHIALNVRDLHADFVAFSAHKMYAPAGLGGLWVSPEAFAEMDPVTAGGGTISHVALDSYYLRQGAIQYELGTPPVALAAGWAAAIGHLRTLGMENVERHGRALTRYLACGLSAVPDVTVWGSHDSDDEPRRARVLLALRGDAYGGGASVREGSAWPFALGATAPSPWPAAWAPSARRGRAWASTRPGRTWRR